MLKLLVVLMIAYALYRLRPNQVPVPVPTGPRDDDVMLGGMAVPFRM